MRKKMEAEMRVRGSGHKGQTEFVLFRCINHGNVPSLIHHCAARIVKASRAEQTLNRTQTTADTFAARFCLPALYKDSQLTTVTYSR